jgi:hypothetical protein
MSRPSRRLAVPRPAPLRSTVGAWRFPIAAAGLAVLLGAALAGCGSAASGSGTGSGGLAPASSRPSSLPGGGGGASGHSGPVTSGDQAGALCPTRTAVTRLAVVRTAPPSVPPAARNRDSVRALRFAFPARVNVTSAAQARAVAAAICGLPVMPSGAVNCPAEFPGTSYQLRFAEGGRRLPVVTVQATGCDVIHGAGPARWVANSPGFWGVLGHAMGLYQARQPVFQGMGPTLHQCQVRTNGRPRLSGCPPLPRISAPVPVN